MKIHQIYFKGHVTQNNQQLLYSYFDSIHHLIDSIYLQNFDNEGIKGDKTICPIFNDLNLRIMSNYRNSTNSNRKYFDYQITDS